MLTVKELIDLLINMPQDAIVTAWDSRWGNWNTMDYLDISLRKDESEIRRDVEKCEEISLPNNLQFVGINRNW